MNLSLTEDSYSYTYKDAKLSKRGSWWAIQSHWLNKSTPLFHGCVCRKDYITAFSYLIARAWIIHVGQLESYTIISTFSKNSNIKRAFISYKILKILKTISRKPTIEFYFEFSSKRIKELKDYLDVEKWMEENNEKILPTYNFFFCHSIDLKGHV